MTRSTTKLRYGAMAALGAIAVAVTTSCSVTIDSLPLPTPGAGGDSYTLDITFDNALNLPTSAKVKSAGADIGEVESMRAQNFTAIVTVRIDAGVQLPVGTTAELRSATPIGDVFVGLTPPVASPPTAPMLSDGNQIPLSDTSAASTIEDLLTRAALVVNGGVIRNMTTLVNGLGDRVGGEGQRVSDLIDDTSRLVGTLSARSNEIQTALNQTSGLTATLQDRQGTLDDAVASAGPALTVTGENTDAMVELVSKLDAISSQLAKFPSIAGTGGRSLTADIDALSAGMNAAATDPRARLQALIDVMPAIAKLTDSQSAHIDVDVAQLALGAVPDPNFPGSDASQIPNATDWANFVGSLSYSLNRLQDKVIGPGR